jgi:putative zinc finger/helix-turn-helix YgiT family protein
LYVTNVVHKKKNSTRKVIAEDRLPPKPADLSPDDIRGIRESLGLSQVEAGELLGGGPRAFTKYESGKIKPAASIANILRVLDANPSALGTLTGSKAVPINNDGNRPFEVTGQHIAALTDRKFTNLTRRLLSAEAQSGNLPMDGIHVAANITAPDGGEDARIEWAGGAERTAYLPNRLSQFQLKATPISPAEAASDVLTSAKIVKPIIRSALEAGGTYVMLCARSYTKKQIAKRENSIRQALAGADIPIKPAQVQFRDADQIAQWANAHPPVAAWVLEQTQPGLIGPFRDWTHWAGRHEHDSSPFVFDARLAKFSEKLRTLVTPPRGVARVVGLSGVGKSRLVLEALGPTDEEESARPRLCDLVLYAVESEAGSITIKSIVQNLADVSIRALVVVDRCASETHLDLAAMVKRSSSRLSLVTIDHEIPPDERLPDDTLLVERADKAVIDGILKHVAPNLPTEDHRRLLLFAAGYPQLARLIGRAWLRDIPIASATDDDLIDRVLIGRKAPDPGLMKDAGMLLSAFGLLGYKPPLDADLAEAAKFSRRTVDDLRAAFDELDGRGVIQRRGRLISLQPRPVAFSLAERQWRRWSPNQWDELLAGNLPRHLRSRAVRQLAMLNTKPIATEVARHLSRLDGPLASLDALSQEEKAEVLSALAEIDSVAVVMLLERVLEPLTEADLKDSVKNGARRQLVHALEKISFGEKTFERGAKLMLDLAVAENESWGNNATGQFKALFPSLLADTSAGPDLRLQVIDDALKSDDPRRLNILVDALMKGAELNSFTRGVGSETHGSRPALEPWTPKIWKEVFDYVRACIKRLTTLALRGDEIGVYARKRLGHPIRGLVSRGLIDFVEEQITKVIAVHRYWPEALSSLGDVLQFDRDSLEVGVEGRVRALMERLKPNQIADRVRFLVSEMPWDYPEDEDLEFDERNNRQIRAVEQLADELLRDNSDALRGYLPQLSRGNHRMVLEFGRAIAKLAKNPLFWRQPIMAAYEATPVNDRNLGVLAGYFAGLAEGNARAVREFKEAAAQSETFAVALPLLCASIGITEKDVELVCRGLKAGVIPARTMMQWVFGGVLAKLSPNAATPLFDQLFTMGEQGFSVAVELMGMYVHSNAQRLEHLRPQLRQAANYPSLRGKKHGSQMDEHHFTQMMKWVLAKGSKDADARGIAMTLAKQLSADPDGDGAALIKPLLPQLMKSFAEIVWPLFGQAIVSDRMKAWRFEHALGDSYSFSDVKQPAILFLSRDTLFAWCHAHPDVGPAFVAAIAPALTTLNRNAPDRQLHPIVKSLLDEFGDREDVLRTLDRNLNTFGWMGSRSNYYALYEEPLRSLEGHPIGAVRKWAKRVWLGFSREIESVRNEDQERDANWEI